MISVSEAKSIIDQHTQALPIIEVPIAAACGCAVAGDILSSADVPQFRQSAMDGYAFQFDGWDKKSPLPVCGEITAGDPQRYTVAAGTAARIFTGAPMPTGADTVVIQERTTLEKGSIVIEKHALASGDNVRMKGSQIKQGETALHRGEELRPATLSFLASIGCCQAKVYSRPRTTVIATGNELVRPGEALQYGQIYESNSIGLAAALQQQHIQPSIAWCRDDESDIAHAIEQALATSDLILLCGGISVGDYDFVYSALESVGVEILFHRIKQRPGKPLCFGKRGKALLFGLPGNPSSALTCYYHYVLPCIRKMSGFRSYENCRIALPLAADYTKKNGLTFFLKGKILGDAVLPLHAQESYRLDSFAHADCLIVLDEERDAYRAGEPVELVLL